MSRLTEKIDRVIARVGKLGRREAFGELQEVFGRLKQRTTLSEHELGRFMDMVTLVLLVYPRGMRIRISGARQAARAREELLEYNDLYEAALNRTVDFLVRNFHTHLEEYDPRQYLRAALRALAKEYGRAREIRNESVEVDSLLERSALNDDPTQTKGLQPADSNPQSPDPYEYILKRGPEGIIFYNWFVGSLSRRELAQLHGLTPEAIDRVILDVARTEFENGRLYPLISSLVHLAEDGDILWLSLKGLTGEQIGQKVALSHWVVYKRLDSVRKRFARIRELGATGRAFGEWLCGVKPELGATDEVRQVLHEYGPGIGLVETADSDRVA